MEAGAAWDHDVWQAARKGATAVSAVSRMKEGVNSKGNGPQPNGAAGEQSTAPPPPAEEVPSTA